ncbi:helix-turn-helix transcriptional regulator [Kitasatospora viridis]|uniref:Regulatory LuxR family protein n=1 Tax=Kitasatospora viridis TaxID=281105 RepID=A0A561S977_9ACTN|nr:AAA family ATPase [Kitasatospora viridis]TWF71414.1 regulatory LuxR family protein [Kitasatospora viridis]
MAQQLADRSPAGGPGFGFVGRRRELARVLEAVRHEPAVVLIEGEAGIGKSRLIREAVLALAAEGRPVLTGLCHPLREPIPFGPVTDALREAGPWLPPVARIPPTAGALAPLLPDLADHLPPPPPHPGDAPAERQLRIQAVRSLLAAIGRVVLVIDDLHWADLATRELLLVLARDMPAPLSLVLAYRPQDLSPGEHVLGSAYRRPPELAGATIQLHPLLEHDVADLAGAALGPDSSPPLVRALFRRSEGLPLVVEEDLLTLVEREPRDPAALATDLHRTPVPAALRETIGERLAGLPEESAALVDAAAVLAVPAAEALLAAVAEIAPERSTEALALALQARALRESGPDRYAFRHVLARQVAYERVPAPIRTRLHRRAIEVLRAHTPPPLVQIAHHLQAVGDRDGWLATAEAAARQAVEVDDLGTAAGLLRQLLEQDDLPAALRSWSALALARMVVDVADAADSTRILGRILADPRLPGPDRGEIRLGLGLLLVNQGQDRAGFREIERSVEELADRPSRAVRAMVALAIDEKRDASAWLDRAERTERQGGCDEPARASIRAARLNLLAREGDPAVWPLLDELPRGCEDPEVRRHTVRALYNVGDLAIELGHDRRAGELLDEAIDLGRRALAPKIEGYILIDRLRLELLAGRWAGLEERMAALARDYPDLVMAEEERRLAGGLMAAARGEWARALEHFGVVAETREKEFTTTPALRAATGAVGVLLARKEPERAWAVAEPALAELRRVRAWPRGTGLVAVAVEAALARGDRKGAQGLVAEAEQGLRGRDAPAATAELLLAQGLLALGSDDAAAVRCFEAARDTWQRIGRPYHEALAAERLAGPLAAAEPDRAAAELAAAAETFDELGATSDLARCQHALRELSQPRTTGRGRRGYGRQLSPRERQVAEFLAQGLGNQEIAQALFLSPRTVEHHVAHVLEKLDVSRKDVRARLARGD